MQKKFFIKRLGYYVLLFTIPLLIVYMVTFAITERQQEQGLIASADMALTNIDSNMELVISNVIFQNDQLTNNSYMLLALKKLLGSQPGISYNEAIYLRNIDALMGSITKSYEYIDNLYLYLNGYDKFVSSESSVEEFVSNADLQWRDTYYSMPANEKTYVEVRTISENNRSRQVLTIYQRMLLLEGVVVMNIDIDKYLNLLDNTLTNEYQKVIFCHGSGQYLFSWNETEDYDWENEDLEKYFAEELKGEWLNIGSERYMVNTRCNETYNINMISLVSYRAKIDSMEQVFQMFMLFWLMMLAVVVFIAYETTRRTFNEISYLIQVFDDAEKGIYPVKPKNELKDEYDVVLNNIIYLFLRTVKLNSNLAQKQREREVAELAALQLQINPHFLFNTLQNVQFQIKHLGVGAEQASKMIDNLSDILKYALSSPMNMISLREEVEYLKKYVAIQQQRFGKEFIVYYEIEDELWDAKVFRLMLQPLVENSILHGIRHISRQGYIKLKAFHRGDLIYFYVIDNGSGIEKNKLQKLNDSMKQINVEHIGLSNVNSRLKLYYGENAGIHVQSKEDWGCIVRFWLPLESDCEKESKNMKK